MKMMRIVFLCSTLSLFFLASCIEDVGNSETIPIDNAVVRYYTNFPGMTFLNTAYGSLAASEIDKEGYKQGDCLFASFTVDYDNQPAPSQYVLVTNIKYEKIGKSSIVMLDAGSQVISDTIDVLSVDSIKGLTFVGSIPCIDNNLFMGFDQLDTKTQNYEYQLVYSDSLINEIPILYVCAKKSGLSSATPYGDYKYQAFDIKPFLNQYADKDNKFSFYLQYKKGVDANNKNVYEFLTEEAVTLFNLEFKDN